LKTSRFLPVVIMLLIVLVAGTVAYIVVEKWNLLDAIYQTIITLSTVGFEEVHSLSPGGRIVTMFLIVGGIGIAAYAATLLGRLVIEGEIREFFGRRKMEKSLKELRDHCIICGYGRMGMVVSDRLRAEKKPLVILDRDPERVLAAREERFLAIEGEPPRRRSWARPA